MVNDKKYLKVHDVEAYRIALGISNFVWGIVIKWDHFTRITIGKQFVNSVDSISANIAEGFGRYHKKDKIKFYYYSRGSIEESFDWIRKSNERKQISQEQYRYLEHELGKLPKEINKLVKLTKIKLTI